MAGRSGANSKNARGMSAIDLEQIRAWHEQGESQRILMLLESRQAIKQPPLALLYYCLALLERGRGQEAQVFANEGLERAVADDLRAEFLALLAYCEARRGEFSEYMAGTRKAVQFGSTPLTLYHLGLASDDSAAGLEALQAALDIAEKKGDQYSAIRNAAALAVPLLRLGRYQEARNWLRYGEQRCQHEAFRATLLHTRAYLQTLLGETEGLEAELRTAMDERSAAYPWLTEPLSTALANLLQSQGRYQEALAIYTDWLALVTRSVWPRIALGCVRALTCLERLEEATTLANTALTIAEGSPVGRGMAELALGIAFWPTHIAEHHLQTAMMMFPATGPLAMEASLYLSALYDRLDNPTRAADVLSPLRSSMQQLADSGLSLLGGRALQAVVHLVRDPLPYDVSLLGQAMVSKKGVSLHLRPRSLELLALLLAHPEGLTAAGLSDAIYGQDESAALRVELYRLKSSLGTELDHSPYRLTDKFTSDVQSLEVLVRRGNIRDAVRLYRGPLLPNSQSPGVVQLREEIETQLVEAVLLSNDLEATWMLAQVVKGDLRLWEALLRLPAADPRLYMVRGRIDWLQKDLEL